jgi:hypothetical protein
LIAAKLPTKDLVPFPGQWEIPQEGQNRLKYSCYFEVNVTRNAGQKVSILVAQKNFNNFAVSSVGAHWRLVLIETFGPCFIFYLTRSGVLSTTTMLLNIAFLARYNPSICPYNSPYSQKFPGVVRHCGRFGNGCMKTYSDRANASSKLELCPRNLCRISKI